MLRGVSNKNGCQMEPSSAGPHLNLYSQSCGCSRIKFIRSPMQGICIGGTKVYIRGIEGFGHLWPEPKSEALSRPSPRGLVRCYTQTRSPGASRGSACREFLGGPWGLSKKVYNGDKWAYYIWFIRLRTIHAKAPLTLQVGLGVRRLRGLWDSDWHRWIAPHFSPRAYSYMAKLNTRCCNT